MTHDKTKCEYCGEKLPLGLNKLSRQLRSHHFENCAARDIKLEALKNDAWNKGVCPVCNTEDGQVEKLQALLKQALVALDTMKHMQWDADTHHGRALINEIKEALK